jgi:hypothetical protein
VGGGGGGGGGAAFILVVEIKLEHFSDLGRC